MVAHAGDEFSPLPMPETREIYHQYIQMGADIVVGHHPHVPENYEIFENKIIFYSLGNFIFDTDYQRIQQQTDTGVLVRLSFTEDSYTWQAMCIHINRNKLRIEHCNLPHIFTNIIFQQYARVWKYAARMLSQANKRENVYFNPCRYARFKHLPWL